MTPTWIWYLVLSAPPVAVLAVAGFNVLVWPRGRVAGRMAGRVSVLIPARNEADEIEGCVAAVLNGTQHPDEVLVYDDNSTDGTGAIVTMLAAADPRVRLLNGSLLPSGWVGKPHACHHLAAAATGDVLVFLDADTVASPTCLARLGSLFDDYGADVVTVGVRHVTRSFAERLVIPLLHLTYLAWLPVPLIWRSRDPRFLIANGQLLAVRREAYDAAGGWQAVRGEVVDDMAFCRRVKEARGRVVFADGFLMAATRMYQGAGEVWSGFSKNLYEGIGGRPSALVGVLILYAWVFLAPYLVLVAAAVGSPIFAAAAIGVAANLALRTMLALRFRQAPEGIVLHPLSIIALLGIAVNSFRWSRRGAIRWRGRSYAARPSRSAP